MVDEETESATVVATVADVDDDEILDIPFPAVEGDKAAFAASGAVESILRLFCCWRYGIVVCRKAILGSESSLLAVLRLGRDCVRLRT